MSNIDKERGDIAISLIPNEIVMSDEITLIIKEVIVFLLIYVLPAVLIWF